MVCLLYIILFCNGIIILDCVVHGSNFDLLVLFLSLILKGAECGWGYGLCVSG